MELFGIDPEITTVPELESNFVPILLWNQAYLKKAKEPLTLAISNKLGQCIIHHTLIRNDKTSGQADKFFVEQLAKSLLWLYGGNKITVVGNALVFNHLRNTFSVSGARASEVVFMSNIYDEAFVVERKPAPPKPANRKRMLTQQLNGYRIGIDINSYDRKCAAVHNGEILYMEQVLWNPMVESDPEFHFKSVVESIHVAAKRLPRIDGIGVSTTGVFVENQARFSDLFHSVPGMDFSDALIDLYPRAAKAMGCGEGLVVENEGDVSALAGAMTMDCKGVLSLHFGHKFTAGFVDNDGYLTGWLNELEHMPIHFSKSDPNDPNSADEGCGLRYFSEEGVLRMAEEAGVKFRQDSNNRQRLRGLQLQAEQNSSKSKLVFQSIGTILGHSLAYYHSLYQFQVVLLTGRIMTGAGGDMIFNAAQKVLAKDYPLTASSIVISLPDENDSQIDLAVAAATLPEIALKSHTDTAEEEN